ncbi:unnamed protein product, partial [Choristocarpus tenellus]
MCQAIAVAITEVINISSIAEFCHLKEHDSQIGRGETWTLYDIARGDVANVQVSSIFGMSHLILPQVGGQSWSLPCLIVGSVQAQEGEGQAVDYTYPLRAAEVNRVRVVIS